MLIVYCEARKHSVLCFARLARRGEPAEVASMVRTQALTLEDLRTRRDEIRGIAARHGARSIRVFGSVARGRARPDSDVDFLVEFEPDRTVLDLSGLILDLREVLDREVNVVEIGKPSRTAVRIGREAVPL